MTTHIRPATPEDLPLIAALIRELAEYERLSHAVHFQEEQLGQNLFGPNPGAEVLIGEMDGTPCGFALFFSNFSTFEGKRGLYLEDLFVRPEARGAGLGKALIQTIARKAVERGYARFEWSVLDWNTPSIRFYESIGAKMQGDWRIMRMDGDALSSFGA